MSEIPERWRDHYEQCEEGFPLAAAVGTHVLQQLGTAESLVRDLARALSEISETRNVVPGGMTPTKYALIARAALSNIPKEMLP